MKKSNSKQARTASEESSAPPASAPIKFLSFADVQKRINRSRWWIRGKINEGKFPRPVSSGGRRCDFVESEIEKYQLGLIASRDADAAKLGQGTEVVKS